MFCPVTIQQHASVYSGFYHIHASYTAPPQNSAQSFTGAFPAIRRILPLLCDGAFGYTAMMRHAGAYYNARTLCTDTRCHHHAGRCTGQRSRPIIIRYIRVQRCAHVVDPRQTVQHIADHASPAGSAPASCGSLASAAPGAPAEGPASPPVQGQPGAVSMLPTPGGWMPGTGSAVMAHRLAPFTQRGSPAASARRAARNHWRLPPQLFSGFRPIANRGQQ